MTLHDPLTFRRQRHGRARDRAGQSLKPIHLLLLGFCLSIFMAWGSSYALALWSQSATMTMQVKAGTLPPPVLSCAKVSGETAVLVSWTPQRPEVSGYDVTVIQNGRIIKTLTGSKNTEVKITAGGGLLSTDSYTVTVTAHYGPWHAAPAAWATIVATSFLLGTSITC